MCTTAFSDVHLINITASMTEKNDIITIYTDGSCHTQHCVGSWVAIVLTGTEKIVLQGISRNTSHHEMELTAVIKALEYVAAQHPTAAMQIFSDSQYVTGLPARKEKLLSAGFYVKNGNPVQHAELVKTLFRLLEQLSVTLIKIPSHQKSSGTINYNKEADILSRKLVRSAIKKHSPK